MGPLASVRRLLMYGEDARLLDLRAIVLSRAGLEVDLTDAVGQVGQRLQTKDYGLLLICHTAREKDVGRLRAAATESGVATYFIDRLLPPQVLVGDVKALLERQN